MKQQLTLLAIAMFLGCGKSAEDTIAIQKLKDEIASLEKHARESEKTAELLRQGADEDDFEGYKFSLKESPYTRDVEPTQEDYLKYKKNHAVIAVMRADEYESWAEDSREKAATKKKILSRFE